MTATRFTRICGSLVCLLTALPTQGQTSPDTDTVVRLEALGKLWATVKYFHPRVGYDLDLNWDDALLDAAPEVLADTHGERYRTIVERMLARLDDPVTRVVVPRGATPAGGALPPAFEWAAPGILLIRLYTLGATGEGIASLKPAVAEARSIIYDARASSWTPQARRIAAWRLEHSGAFGATERGPLVLPAERLRMHFGLDSEGMSNTSFMHSGFYTVNGRVITDSGRADVPGVVLVDAAAAVPAALYALWRQGRVTFIGSAPPDDEHLVTARTISLADGLAVQVRFGQLVDAAGPLGRPLDRHVPDPAAGGGDPALIAAVRQLGGQWQVAVSPAPTVPAMGAFITEREYREPLIPDVGHRVLAAVRIWAAINYLYPYKSLLHEDWDASLRGALPTFIEARTAVDYHLAVAEYVARIKDSHGFVLGPAAREAFGAVPPLRVRLIEGQPVVIGFRTQTSPVCGDPLYWLGCQEEPLPDRALPGVRVGDIVTSVDGEGFEARMTRLAPFVSASTDQALRRDVVYRALAGPLGSTVTVTLKDEHGLEKTVALVRTALDTPMAHMAGGRSGDVYRFVADGVGYADLARLKPDSIEPMFERFKDAKAIIFDMRGYPAGANIHRNLPYDANAPAGIGKVPVASWASQPSPQWLFAELAVTQWGRQTGGPVLFKGRTVLLIDDRAQSYSESVGMSMKGRNGTTFVGSPSAGANGPMVNLMVPGGIRVYFTGAAAVQTNGSQFQQVGMKPDVAVAPTIAGIRANRDEVLERALQLLSGGQ